MAASCACVARSRASNARAIAPDTSGFSSRSWASLPSASSPCLARRSRRLALPLSSIRPPGPGGRSLGRDGSCPRLKHLYAAFRSIATCARMGLGRHGDGCARRSRPRASCSPGPASRPTARTRKRTWYGSSSPRARRSRSSSTCRRARRRRTWSFRRCRRPPSGSSISGRSRGSPAAAMRPPRAARRPHAEARARLRLQDAGQPRRRRRRARHAHPDPTSTPTPTPAPTAPPGRRDARAGPAGGAGGRRPEPAARALRDPALPAPDLPGGRRRVRRALGGARRDQRDRDGLRAQPERLVGGRGRLDAVPALDLEGLRDRRQPRRRTPTRLQPRRRDLLRRALPARRGRRPGPARRDLRLQPRRLVRELGGRAGARHRRAAEAFIGALTGLSEGRFPVHARARYPNALTPAARARAARRAAAPPRGAASRSPPAGRARRRRQRRQDRARRALGAARALRPAAGRLRQHVHVRQPALGGPHLSGARAREGEPGGGAARARAAAARRQAQKPASATRRPAATERRAAARRTAAAPRKERLHANPTRPELPRDEYGSPSRAASDWERLWEAYGAGSRPIAKSRPRGARRRAAAGPASTAPPSASSARAQGRHTALAAPGRAGRRRHRARAHRHDAGRAAALRFEVRPAGAARPAHRPQADPRRLAAARVDAIYRAEGDAFDRGARPSIGQVLLMDEASLAPARAHDRASSSTLRPRRTSAPGGSTAACSPRSRSCLRRPGPDRDSLRAATAC